MLARLVREALFHLHHERRHQASLLLGTSPHAGPLATELVEAVDNTDELFTGRALSLLPYLAPPDMLRGALLNWALHHPSNSLRSLSLRALAHLRSPLSIEEQESVLHATLCASTASVRSAGLYLLGAIGSPLLASVLEGGDDLQRRRHAGGSPSARSWMTSPRSPASLIRDRSLVKDLGPPDRPLAGLRDYVLAEPGTTTRCS